MMVAFIMSITDNCRRNIVNHNDFQGEIPMLEVKLLPIIVKPRNKGCIVYFMGIYSCINNGCNLFDVLAQLMIGIILSMWIIPSIFTVETCVFIYNLMSET